MACPLLVNGKGAGTRLERNQRTRILACSYTQRQAGKIRREIRKLARVRGVTISEDRDTAGEWETEAGGGVRAVGAGAGWHRSTPTSSSSMIQ